MSIRAASDFRLVAAAFGVLACVAVTAALAVQGQTAGGLAKPADDALAPLVSWYGPKSAVREAKFGRAMNAEQWTKLWDEHEGKASAKDNVGVPFIPRVNFEKCMVIGIFQGARTNSNGVTIEAITEEASCIRVRYDEMTFQTSGGLNGGGGAVSVTPYGIFVVPRSNKPIVIEENVQGLKDNPARWKERAKLE